jgi:triacylglycerol lipase
MRIRSLAPLLLGALLTVSACTADSINGPGRRPSFSTTGILAHEPVLFVHGWNASSTTWTTMVGRFKADGYTDAELVNWSYNGAQSNKTTAQLIAQKVDSIMLVTGATRVDIITHSMGALSARYYVRNLGGDGKVDALVTLGGTNHGTNTAFFCGQTACVEMRPNSAFLTALNATTDAFGTPRYAAWWSNCDEVISPRSSAKFTATNSTNTQTACLKHSQLHEDATVYAQVRAWVNPQVLASQVSPFHSS